MKKYLSIILAIALVVVMMVPVFATTITAEPVDTVEPETTTAPEDCGETAEPETTIEDGEHRHVWDNEGYSTVTHFYCKCGEFFVMPHDEMTCEHEFVTEFDASYHWDRCVYCGYRAGTRHELEEAFYGETHYTECACGYAAGMHYGVEYHAVDDNHCYTYCGGCGHETISSHDWDGFMCRDCGRELNGPTGAIVKNIFELEEGYRVRFDVNGESHYIDLEEVCFEKGDFVVIEHNGNEIEEANLFIAKDVINLDVDSDTEAFREVIHLVAVRPRMVIDLKTYEDYVFLVFEKGDNGYAYGCTVREETIIYNFRSGRAVDTDWVAVGDTVISTKVGDQHIVLVY